MCKLNIFYSEHEALKHNLPIYKNIAFVTQYFVDFVFHLLFLCHFKLCDLSHRVYFDSGTEHLNLVCVHGSIGNEDVGILYTFRLVYSYLK